MFCVNYLKPQPVFIEADGKIPIEFSGGKNKVLIMPSEKLISSSVLMYYKYAAYSGKMSYN